jgi:hypothetical protein
MLAQAPASSRPALFLHVTHRLVTQAEHVWIVREADETDSPHASPSRCLVCESAQAVRRARQYPADWNRLTDVELLKLFA